MATFKIHEDDVVLNNKCGKIKEKSKIFQNHVQNEGRVPMKRIPTQTTANIILNKENLPTKKTVYQDDKAFQSSRNHPEIIEYLPKNKEYKISTNFENFDKTLSFKEVTKENSENVLHPREKFYFPIDQLYLTTSEYHDNIYVYLIQLERSLKRPKLGYMLKQPQLTNKMRSILVDWLCSVSEEYNMNPQTLHLAVQYVDCFLSRMSVVKSKFQLVGTAAMMIAAKYEEIYPPDSKEWAELAAHSFTQKQLFRMEQLILKALQFCVAQPTTYSFINHICFVCNLPKELMLLAMYFSELVLLEGDDYVKYFPSELASASLALARHTVEEKELWPKKLEIRTGYSLKQLSPIIKRQNKSFKNSPTHSQQAIQEKFKTAKYGKVALFHPKEFNDYEIMEE